MQAPQDAAWTLTIGLMPGWKASEGCAMPDLVVYEATLYNPQSLVSVQAARPAIERVGGRVEIDRPSVTGMITVTLWLPSAYFPSVFLPGLPFYPI